MNAEPKKVYVVMVSVGEYSDREVNCCLSFFDKEEAKEHVKNLTIQRDRFILFQNEQWNDLSNKMGIVPGKMTIYQKCQMREQKRQMLEEKILEESFDLIRPYYFRENAEELKFYIEDVELR